MGVRESQARASLAQGAAHTVKRALRFWAAIAPSFVAVAAIALDAEFTWRTGVEVTLEVRPFDPMDPLAGRFLATPLAIARLDVTGLVNHCPDASPGDTIWVELSPGEPWWSASAVLAEPAESPRTALRGVLRDVRDGTWMIDFGVERFFIPHEAADPTVTGAGPRPQLVASVRVTRSGSAVLAGLLVDGEPYEQWNARQASDEGVESSEER